MHRENCPAPKPLSDEVNDFAHDATYSPSPDLLEEFHVLPYDLDHVGDRVQADVNQAEGFTVAISGDAIAAAPCT